jgi:hypothetical protein
MQNYWLSDIGVQKMLIKNINEAARNNKVSDQEPEDDAQDSQDDAEDGPDDRLNDRQKMMYETYESIVEMHGLFNQTSKADGAHYAPAEKNPFIEEGMVCGNCVFFVGGGRCEIVSGKIEPNAICKLWIIPQELIRVSKK